MDAEFRYGDRVKWVADGFLAIGTVVDERTHHPMGSFTDCLPSPVAVLWDEPGEVWWSPGLKLEHA